MNDDANIGHIAEHGVAPEEAEEAIPGDPLDIGFGVVDGEDRWTYMARPTRDEFSGSRLLSEASECEWSRRSSRRSIGSCSTLEQKAAEQ